MYVYKEVVIKQILIYQRIVSAIYKHYSCCSLRQHYLDQVREGMFSASTNVVAPLSWHFANRLQRYNKMMT